MEVKCPHETTFLDVLLNREQSVAYQLYWCQVQQQLLVAEAERGFLYFYHQGQDVEFEIERDEAFLTQLIETAMDFWSAVKSGQEPKKDPERDLLSAPRPCRTAMATTGGRLPAERLAKMDDLKVQLKALELQQADHRTTLVGLMGDYLAAEHSGLRVSRFQMQGSIDYKAALTPCCLMCRNRHWKAIAKNRPSGCALPAGMTTANSRKCLSMRRC